MRLRLLRALSRTCALALLGGSLGAPLAASAAQPEAPGQPLAPAPAPAPVPEPPAPAPEPPAPAPRPVAPAPSPTLEQPVIPEDADPAVTSLTGVLVSRTKDQLVLKDEQGTEHRFRLDERTRFVWPETSKTQDLAPGARIRTDFSPRDEQHLALSVWLLAAPL